MLQIQQFAKTAEGVALIESQALFCCGGKLWQGYMGACIQCRHNQLTDEEMNRVRDVDGTLDQVWEQRRKSIEARDYAKMEEYDKRRVALRRERNEIRDSMKTDKELGIPENPDDLNQLKRIDLRMARLSNLSLQTQEKIASAQAGIDKAAEEKHEPKLADKMEKPPEKLYACSICGHVSPPEKESGKTPKRWLQGHMLGKHKKGLPKDLTAPEVSEILAAGVAQES